MSVEFAQQTELARINKRALQTSSSMQTQSDDEELEEREKDEPTPKASLTAGGWLEEVERERLERELEERNAEIRKLKEELQKSELRPEQVSGIYSAVTRNVFSVISLLLLFSIQHLCIFLEVHLTNSKTEFLSCTH